MPAKLTRPENSFNNIYMRYYKKSFLFVKSYIHNEMVAEDIASESLIKLWQWIQDNPVENIEPMLLSILRNKALDYLRHESMKQQVITRISEKQNEELALRLSSLEYHISKSLKALRKTLKDYLPLFYFFFYHM